MWWSLLPCSWACGAGLVIMTRSPSTSPSVQPAARTATPACCSVQISGRVRPQDDCDIATVVFCACKHNHSVLITFSDAGYGHPLVL